MPPREFRVFVSSTFNDLRAERDALHARVFPRLRELCVRSGARFQEIDLRWGVSDEAGADQRTMAICLEEIERCRRTTPRPNFIVLLGDRYGWRPLPASILETDFAMIRPLMASDDRRLLDRWYARDRNAVPVEYVLLPRRGPATDPASWAAVEAQLGSALRAATAALPLEAATRVRYEGSATEQEIYHGALRVPSEYVAVFFRTIDHLPASAPSAAYTDLILDADGSHRRDPDAMARLEQLKERLRSLYSESVYEYTATWTGQSPSTDHLEQLCEDAYAAIAGIIEQELDVPPGDSLVETIEAHRLAGQRLSEFFRGGAGQLDAIDEYIRAPGPNVPLVVVGPAGIGKSTLLAEVARRHGTTSVGEARAALMSPAERAQMLPPRHQVVVRFVGATEDSTDDWLLLRGICAEIATIYGLDASAQRFGGYFEERELILELRDRLLPAASVDRPLLIVIDGIDRLSDSEWWVPDALPESVRVLVSASSREWTSGPKVWVDGKLTEPQPIRVGLAPLPVSEGAELLDAWLSSAGRRLEPAQRAEVMTRFADVGLPLYLKLAFEEARLWRSYSPPGETTLAPGVSALLRDNLVARLSRPENHGRALVEATFRYIAASRGGLAEDELIALLSDPDAPPSLRIQIRSRPRQERQPDDLPPVLWSRLLFDLEPYLIRRRADGATVLTFFHDRLAEIGRSYSTPDALEVHRQLARYFAGLPLGGDGVAAPNERKLAELPYQQLRGELWDDFAATLSDQGFLWLFLLLDRAGDEARRRRLRFQLREMVGEAARRWPDDREVDELRPVIGLLFKLGWHATMGYWMAPGMYSPLANTYDEGKLILTSAVYLMGDLIKARPETSRWAIDVLDDQLTDFIIDNQAGFEGINGDATYWHLHHALQDTVPEVIRRTPDPPASLVRLHGYVSRR